MDSIINQKYDNYEIICVDDGSTDSSAKILSYYIEKYSFVKYYYQNNSGQSAARNLGIKYATGDVLCFIDSDDLVNNCLFAKINNIFSTKNVDVVLFNMEIFHPDGLRYMCLVGPNYPQVSTLLDSSLDEKCYNFTNAAVMAIKKDKLSNSFVEGMIYEDWVFMNSIMSTGLKVYYLHEPLYYYRRNYYDSTTKNISNRCLDLFKAYHLADSILYENKKFFAVHINDLKILIESIGFYIHNFNLRNNAIKTDFYNNIVKVVDNLPEIYINFLCNYLSSEQRIILKIIDSNNNFNYKRDLIIIIHYIYAVKNRIVVKYNNTIWKLKALIKFTLKKFWPSIRLLFGIKEGMYYYHENLYREVINLEQKVDRLSDEIHRKSFKRKIVKYGDKKF